MIQIFDCEQGTPEWHACRLGIPTASRFATVLAKGQGGGPSKTRREYMMKLLGERITGEPMDSYSNAHMERGKEMEAEAREMYAFMTDLEPVRVGFIRNDDKGGSPDSLVGNNGALEIKTKLAHLQMEVLLSGKTPTEHIPQLQGILWIAEREWIDFESYWPKTQPFIQRAYRDEDYIKKLADAVRIFNDELGTLEVTVRGGSLEERLRASLKGKAA